MVLFFVQKFVFGQHVFNIRLYDKNSESNYFFPSIENRIFFQQHRESEYLEKKNIAPPLAPGS
jgi:hypothetical protein